jgi:hypothetical protein
MVYFSRLITAGMLGGLVRRYSTGADFLVNTTVLCVRHSSGTRQASFTLGVRAGTRMTEWNSC